MHSRRENDLLHVGQVGRGKARPCQFGSAAHKLHTLHGSVVIETVDVAGGSLRAGDERAVLVDHPDAVVVLAAADDTAVLADVLEREEVPVLRCQIFGNVVVRHVEINGFLTRGRCCSAGCFGFHLGRGVGRHATETDESLCGDSRRYSRFHCHSVYQTAIIEGFVAYTAQVLAKVHFLQRRAVLKGLVADSLHALGFYFLYLVIVLEGIFADFSHGSGNYYFGNL